MARRLHGVANSPTPEHLTKRMAELESGALDKDLDELVSMDLDGLKAKYAERVIEKAVETEEVAK